jgi:hypothetical protein
MNLAICRAAPSDRRCRSESPDAVGRPVDGVDDGDALLDPLALGDVEPDSSLVGGPVDLVLDSPLGERHLDEPRLEGHRNGGAVGDGAAEVVDVDVVAEDLAGVVVAKLIGVPVKAMSVALGRASLRWRA